MEVLMKAAAQAAIALKSPNKRKPLRSSPISNYKSSHRQMQRSAETYNHYETDDDDYNDLIDDDRNDDDQVIVA